MANNISTNIISNFVYEVIERIVRFHVHLDEIKVQFYKDDSMLKDKIDLINNYKFSLCKLLNILLATYRKTISSEDQEIKQGLIDITRDILRSVNELHTEYLSILPRPSVPVELTRFERVIHKQIIHFSKNEEKQNISISINENIGEEISSDPLYEYKNQINTLIDKYKLEEDYGISKLDTKIKDDRIEKLLITIPRIDAGNTFRWPSLIHEMAHSIFQSVEFDNGDIESQFLSYISLDKDNAFNGFFKPDNSKLEAFPTRDTLKSWLEECWCDLFACILIGPSFYLSQYLTFFNEREKSQASDFISHPPSLFRLDLIEAILAHRFPTELYKLLGDKYIAEHEDLLTLLRESDKLSIATTKELINIYNSFNQFFISYFFPMNEKNIGVQIKGNSVLNEKLSPFVRKYVNMQPAVISYLVEQLNLGLPIPSIKTVSTNGEYKELPTYVQEIFLASWLSRTDSLRPSVLKAIVSFENEKILADPGYALEAITKIISRHDQAVLKSIQVSEWFDFFIQEEERPEQIEIYNSEKKNCKELLYNGVLVDTNIKTLIEQNELKIIPMMYMKYEHMSKQQTQIGTTSLDIRLGTSFQIFYPDQYGIIDFTQETSSVNYNISSKRINLDFLESITITPGQFLLGHSMEYVKLPDYISGNLEGRSSFARLGIEIHMTAGYIDPGFEGVITFEIYNAGPTTVKLYPGMRIGQIRFEKNEEPQETYSQKHTVKYKGLLEHDLSRQNKDIEVTLIKEYRKKTSKNGIY